VRTCTDCGQVKPITEFTRNKGTRWTHTRCKPCRARRAREAKWAQLPEAERRERELRYLKGMALEGITTLDRPPESDFKRCIGCDQVKSLTDFTPIKSRPGQHHSRCKPCRNAKARTRYYSSPEFDAAEIARSWRNKVARRAPYALLSAGHWHRHAARACRRQRAARQLQAQIPRPERRALERRSRHAQSTRGVRLNRQLDIEPCGREPCGPRLRRPLPEQRDTETRARAQVSTRCSRRLAAGQGPRKHVCVRRAPPHPPHRVWRVLPYS
jgi:hypothetical protein